MRRFPKSPPTCQRVQPDRQGDIARLTDSFHLNLTAFGFLSFAVGLFIVHATIGLAFEQRRAVIRTLRALGMPNRTIVQLLLAETVLLALIAGLLGVVLGYAIAAMLLPDVAATLAGLYGASVPGSLTLRPDWILTGLAIAFAGAFLAVGQGLWRIARLPLLAPAQPRAWAMASRRNAGWTALSGAVLLLAALALAWFGRGLASGFLTLGALLLGAGLLLPGFSDPGSRARCAHIPFGDGRMGVGRHATAGAGPVAGADRADDRTGGQCRRQHHGRIVPVHVYWLARPASCVRTLCFGRR